MYPLLQKNIKSSHNCVSLWVKLSTGQKIKVKERNLQHDSVISRLLDSYWPNCYSQFTSKHHTARCKDRFVYWISVTLSLLVLRSMCTRYRKLFAVYGSTISLQLLRRWSCYCHLLVIFLCFDIKDVHKISRMPTWLWQNLKIQEIWWLVSIA